MKRIGAVLLTAAVTLSACGSGGGDVTLADAWARASAPTQTTGAVYFDVTVAVDDTLVGASVPSSVASGAEIHEVVMDPIDEMSGDEMDDMEMSEGSDDMHDMGAGAGQMRMQEMPEGLALTGGETVSFEPGSYHVMLPDLAEPLEVGDEFDLTLEFANTDDVTVAVTVAETAP